MSTLHPLPSKLWIESCTRRREALAEALAAMVEHAALARALAEGPRALGDAMLASTLEREAEVGESFAAIITAMQDEIRIVATRIEATRNPTNGERSGPLRFPV